MWYAAGMTDLTVSLPGPLAADVRAAAEARGLSPEEYVHLRLAADVAFGDDPDMLFADSGIEEDLALAAEFDRDAVGIPGDEVLAWLRSIGTDGERPRPLPRKLK